MEKGLEKLLSFKDKINSIFSMFSGGNKDNNPIDKIFKKMNELKE